MSKPNLDDRELLELAAKAAGIEVWPGVGFQAHTLFTRPAKADPDGKLTGVEWNPLTDDGDALRLAVGLGINVNFGNQEEGAVIAFDFSGRFQDCEESGEPRAAYRRAVVRAAAEIGKGMP